MQPSPAAMTALLALMGLLNSFGSDLFIPALRAMTADLGATPWQAQQTVSLFFIASAFMSLWHGALADAFGRRPTILASLAVLGIAALGCVVAERVGQLWGLRILQGMAAGSGMVISRAIVGDLHKGFAAQHLLSRIMMVQTASLIAIPMIGGWLTLAFGWRSIFVCIAGITLMLGLANWRWLPETLPGDRRHSLHPALLWRSYRQVLASPSFLRLSLAHVANWTSMTMYVVAAPAIVIGLLGRSEADIWLVYLPIALGLLAGFVIFSHLVRRLGTAELLTFAYGVLALAVAFNLALCWLFAPGLLHLVPLFIYSLGMALALPLLLERALEPVRDRAGVASSCQTFLQFAAMGLAAGLLVPLLWDSALKLALGTSGITALGALFLLWEGHARSRAAAGRMIRRPEES
ncbi:MAG TPA: multidrug effflux MFS transporter [Burkholderiales bacterium]